MQVLEEKKTALRQTAEEKKPALRPAFEVERKEVKYFISYSDFIAMDNALEKALDRDPYDRGEGYFIRSLYFDSLLNKAFEEKMAGIERRKKIRLRMYDFKSGKVKLEVKNKANDSILKESIWIAKKDAMQMQEGNYEALLDYDSPVARKVYAEFRKFCYRPVVVIDYERSAFVHDFNNIRVTFDRNIRADSINLNIFNKSLFMKPLLSRKLVVLEIKFDRFMPDWLKSVIRMKSCHSAISKYCIGRLDNRIGWI